MANTDPAKQAANATRMTSKRVNDAALHSPSPEIEDAQDLEEKLDPTLALKLQGASRELPKGEQYDGARNSGLLAMQARHDLIVKLFAQGMRRERIARAIGVTTKTVNSVLSSYFVRKEDELRNQRMDTFVLHMAEGYIEDMDRLQDVIVRSTSASNIVGAIKARNDAREKYTNLLADFGFIARKPQELHVSGENVTIDNRMQNVIVVSQDELRSFTKKLLADKREVDDAGVVVEGEVVSADLVSTADGT